ncbi:MAG: potassium channel family protein [Candidatus Hatepunaea meridiana]|nr:potassium channel family protein [Candidatus Hatepunaea meridiana]
MLVIKILLPLPLQISAQAIGGNSNCRSSLTRDRTKIERVRDALYFSVNTFTTVGYGDWVPTEEVILSILIPWLKRNKASKLGVKPFMKMQPVIRFRTLAMFEGLCGWLLLALFLVTLGRIWIR